MRAGTTCKFTQHARREGGLGAQVGWGGGAGGGASERSNHLRAHPSFHVGSDGGGWADGCSASAHSSRTLLDLGDAPYLDFRGLSRERSPSTIYMLCRPHLKNPGLHAQSSVPSNQHPPAPPLPPSLPPLPQMRPPLRLPLPCMEMCVHTLPYPYSTVAARCASSGEVETDVPMPDVDETCRGACC